MERKQGGRGSGLEGSSGCLVPPNGIPSTGDACSFYLLDISTGGRVRDEEVRGL